MKIAVIGSGPAGCSAAYFLARNNHEVLLIDPVGPKEKTCGGGVPAKCLLRFPEFYSDFEPAEIIHDEMIFSFDGVDSCRINMPGGMGIFSRQGHDEHIFNKALSEGVKFLKETFKKCETRSEGWTVKTDSNEYEVDFIVGADGAVSRVRNQLCNKLTKESYFKAADYLISSTDMPLHIGFDSSLNGYLWTFPRRENCSVGIVDYGDNQSYRMKLLDDYLNKMNIKESDIIKKRSALIPSLRKDDIKKHKIAGKNWALVGDAAAMAEPITGEGIYYAVYSSYLFAECLENDKNYDQEWKKAFSRLISETAVSRKAYKFINKRFMKFMFRRSSILRFLTGEYLAALKHGRVYRVRFFLTLPFALVQALVSKPARL